MEAWWPWLTIAGLGALHGASPASGWMFAAARGVRTGDGAQVRRALWPIAIGHGVSVAIVVCVVSQGVLMDRAWVQRLAGALLIGLALYRAARSSSVKACDIEHDAPAASGGMRAGSSRMGDAGIVLWSCLMATAHGAGLMLVPALVPLCMSDNPARAITASGSIVLALTAVGVHLATMLVTTGVIASGVCRGVAAHPRLLRSDALGHGWAAGQAMIGIALMVFD